VVAPVTALRERSTLATERDSRIYSHQHFRSDSSRAQGPRWLRDDARRPHGFLHVDHLADAYWNLFDLFFVDHALHGDRYALHDFFFDHLADLHRHLLFDFFDDLLAEKLGYEIVYDESSTESPRWLYPKEMVFVDNRLVILKRAQ
jgi:hypothetical protein